MSTLTVCPYCGDALRFDAMKTHLVVCEGRSPIQKSRAASQSAKSPSPRKTRAVSGLDFYNQLNKLSRLARPASGSRSASRRRVGGKASDESRNTTVDSELAYPASSLELNVASTHPSSTASESGGKQQWQDRTSTSRREMPSSIGENGTTTSSFSAALAAEAEVASSHPPPPASVHVRLNTTSASSPFIGVDTTYARAQHGGYSEAASSSPIVGPGGATGDIPYAASHGRSDTVRHRDAVERVLGTSHEGLNASRAQNGDVRKSGPRMDSTRDSTYSPSQPFHVDATPVLSSAPSRRPPPQQSSFAIRLRGSGGGGSSGPYASSTKSHSAVFDSAWHAKQPPVSQCLAHHDAWKPLEHTVSQLFISFQQMEQLVRRQQEQYNALLKAHADLHRQVATHQGACNGIAQRSADQVMQMEAALQRHTCQWQREQAALQESVSALWTNVTDLQGKVMHEAPPRLASSSEAATTTATTVAATAPPSSHGAPHVRPTLRAPASATYTVNRDPYNASSEPCRGEPSGMCSTLPSFTHRQHPEQQAQQRFSKPSTASIHVVQHASTVRAGEESTYYSDLESFVQPDLALHAASMLPNRSADGKEEHRALSTPAIAVNRTGGYRQHSGVHDVSMGTSFAPQTRKDIPAKPTPAASRSTVDGSFMSNKTSLLSPMTPRSSTQPRTASYAMDVSQQRQASMEERVMAMLHAKPTVVVQRSPWE